MLWAAGVERQGPTLGPGLCIPGPWTVHSYDISGSPQVLLLAGVYLPPPSLMAPRGTFCPGLVRNLEGAPHTHTQPENLREHNSRKGTRDYGGGCSLGCRWGNWGPRKGSPRCKNTGKASGFGPRYFWDLQGGIPIWGLVLPPQHLPAAASDTQRTRHQGGLLGASGGSVRPGRVREG